MKYLLLLIGFNTFALQSHLGEFRGVDDQGRKCLINVDGCDSKVKSCISINGKSASLRYLFDDLEGEVKGNDLTTWTFKNKLKVRNDLKSNQHISFKLETDNRGVLQSFISVLTEDGATINFPKKHFLNCYNLAKL